MIARLGLALEHHGRARSASSQASGAGDPGAHDQHVDARCAGAGRPAVGVAGAGAPGGSEAEAAADAEIDATGEKAEAVAVPVVVGEQGRGGAPEERSKLRSVGPAARSCSRTASGISSPWQKAASTLRLSSAGSVRSVSGARRAARGTSAAGLRTTTRCGSGAAAWSA